MTSIFTELKRRNVFKVGVAYAIVAWLLIQVVTAVLPTFEAPLWVAQTITFVILLGFPIAVFLAWAYEITPEGLKPSHQVEVDESVTHLTGRKIDFIIIGVLVLALGYFVIDKYLPVQTAPDVVVEEEGDGEGPIPIDPAPEPVVPAREVLPNSVAVLPFENVSPDPDNAYFAIGVHEEILNHLARIRDLSVIARTSVLPYAGSGKSIPEIAEELNVETVMEGSVRYDGNRVRITTQLIEAETGVHLWSEAYDRELEDIFAIQTDIATRIASALQAQLTPEERARIENIPTVSPEAYDLYLQVVTSVGSPGGFQPISDEAALLSNIAKLDRALELDPEFANAYPIKARLYLLRGETLVEAGLVPDRETATERAREYLETALEIDQDVASAYLQLAEMSPPYAWDEVHKLQTRALELNPNSVEVLLYNISFKLGLGLDAEAISLAERLIELDPGDPYYLLQLGLGYWGKGDLETAVSVFNDVRELAPAFPEVYLRLAQVELSRGNLEQALEHARYAEELARGSVVNHGIVSEFLYIYDMTGATEDAARMAERLEKPARMSAIALVHLGRGESEQALEALRDFVDDPYGDFRLPVWNYPTPFITWNLFNDPILEKPEFVELREKLGYRSDVR